MDSPFGYFQDKYEVEYEDVPSHETVFVVNGEPGRTIAKATKYNNKIQKPFVVKNTIRASMNLWEDLEKLCLNHEEESNLTTPTKQYADINTEPNLQQEQEQVIDIDGKGFDLGTNERTTITIENNSSIGNTPKKPSTRNTKRLDPILPNTKLLKNASFPPLTTPSEPIDETQRIAKKTLQKESRNDHTIDSSLSSRQRNSDSTSNESEEEESCDPSMKRNIAQSNKVSWSIKNKPKQHKITKNLHCSAKKISYSEAQKNRPVQENGEEERDFGGGPSGITIGGLKQESFEFFSYKIAAASEKRKWHKDEDINAREKHVIRKKAFIHPTEFGREDLLRLDTHTDKVLAKFDTSYKLSPLMFKLRAALVLIQGCRYGIMKVVEFFFANYSYAFKVDNVFAFNYLCDISNTPNYWFLSLNHLKVSKQTLPVGQTLLHIAASNRHLDIVKYLVEVQGASLEIEDCCGYTPVMVSTCNLEIVKYFVSKKCNVNHQNKYGVTPLMMTTINGYCKGVVECLVEAGADLLLSDTSGRSAIHYFISAFRLDELEKFMTPKFFPTSRVGYLSYAGLPLFLHLMKIHEIEVLLKCSFVTPSQKVSLKLTELLAKTKAKAEKRDHERYETLLREGIRYREKMGIEFEEPPLLEAYGNRREAKTEAELDDILSKIPSGSSRLIEMCYQALLISDRICGVNSYSSLSLQYVIFYEVYYLTRNEKDYVSGVKQPVNKVLADHCLKMIDRFAECSVWLATAAGPIKEIYDLFHVFIIKYNEITLLFQYHEPPTDTIARIHNNFSDAIIIYSRNTSYTHIHHSTFIYQPNDNCLITSWVHHLVQKGPYYDWFRPARRHFYAQLDFSFIVGNHVSTLPISFLSLGGVSSEDLREYLEVAGHYWLSRPGFGTFALQHCGDVYKSTLTSYLIEYGIHPDVVTHEGKYPLDFVAYNPYLWRKIRSQLTPPSLSCICARFIATEIKYEDLLIPQRIKEFISIHDIYGHLALYRKHFGYPQ